MAQAFVLTLAGLAAFMAAQPTPRTLEHIWHGCVFFFGARLLQSASRLGWLAASGALDRRAEGEESGSDQAPDSEASGEEEAQGEVVAVAPGAGGGAGGAGKEQQHEQRQDGSGGHRTRRPPAASPDPSGGQLELAP